MLAQTIVIPIAGKLSDLYGRRALYIAGMGLFLLGSILCGTATSIEQLIAYRAVQGLGGGAIFPVALATIADLFPPSERGKISGLFGGVWGISSVIGPFLGGWIVDTVHIGDIASWRWVFYVNVPVGLAGIAMVAAYFPRHLAQRKAVIDSAGIATLTLGLLAGLLITVWGGDTYPWASAPIFGLAALSLASLAAFVLIERRAREPVLPLAMFRNPIFVVSVLASLVAGAVMFSIIIFMPTYLQAVVGITPTYAGTALVPLSLGVVTGSMSSGFMMKRFGYKPFAVSGFILTLVGYVLLSRLGEHPSILVAVLDMVVLGVGIGFTIQTYIVATQNSIERRYIGASTSSITLFRMLGATAGVTILGVILNRQLAAGIRERLPAGALDALLPAAEGKVGNIPLLLVRPQFLASADPAVIEGIRSAYAEAMTVLFLISAAVSILGLLIALTLKSIPMKSAAEYLAEGKPVPLTDG
jgi:EmrB/QacA subfamily drug resistance transporter